MITRAPVYYMLLKTKFNFVARIDKYIDDIQDLLRKSGFTIFQPGKFLTINLSRDGSTESTTENRRWFMTKQNKTAGFVIDQDSFSYHTTDYTGHETCFSDFLTGLQDIHEVVNFDHFVYLGLRYLI